MFKLLWGMPLAAMLALGVAGCREDAAVPPPVEVGFVTARQESLPLQYSYSARTQGEREIDVRARIGGTLLKRLYREGDYVAAGTPLFKIDPAPYQVAVRSAEGRLGVAQAQWRAAGPQRERMQQLFGRGIVTPRDRDRAEEAYESAQAAVAAATAELEQARLELSYTDVRAPISGYTGRAAQSEGSLVRPDDDTAQLTTMAQSRRLYVNFTVPTGEARLLREALAQAPDTVQVRLETPGADGAAIAARIEFVDPRVQADTGTVAVRATVENGSDLLAPGQFVKANVSGLQSASAIYLPEKAVLHGAAGPFVWKLDPAGQVAMQNIVLGSGHGNHIAVTQGVAAGDRIVVEGILKLAPGAPVKAVPVTGPASASATAAAPAVAP